MFSESQDGDVVIIRHNGVFKQCALATYNGQLFAKVGGGYVRLTADGKTSVPSMQVEAIVSDMPLFKDRLGRLCSANGDGRTALAPNDRLLLGNQEGKE